MRVPRTFSFVDLSGFTNYTAAFGDDAAGRILGTFRSLVREIASERGVRIAKWLGDGCMVVSIEQVNAVAFALDLEHRSAEVVPVEAVLALLAQFVHQLPQTLEAFTVAVAHAFLHHPAKRRVHVAVVQEVVGELVEQRVGIEIETSLGAVPT